MAAVSKANSHCHGPDIQVFHPDHPDCFQDFIRIYKHESPPDLPSQILCMKRKASSCCTLTSTPKLFPSVSMDFWKAARSKFSCGASASMIMVKMPCIIAVSYTHLRAHETDSYLVCRLLLEKKKK